MVKSKLVGKFESIRLECVDDTFRDKRMFLVQGTLEEMCSFYESVKDALENAVNASTKKHGFEDSNGVNIGYEADDLMDWRTYPKEIAAYDRAKENAKRDCCMRFVAEETRFVPDDSPRSWVKALEAAIASTGIEVEPEAVEV